MSVKAYCWVVYSSSSSSRHKSCQC